MSCFGGHMNEYILLSLDRFDGVNLESTSYWLSHAHSDHMVGLSSEALRSHLRHDPRIKIYCTEVTKSLLCHMKDYRHLEPYLVSLPVDQPTVVDLPHPKVEARVDSITVTLIPAGHCPGSAMLLVEGDEGCVLYTGDFRLEVGTTEQISWLHDSLGEPKKLKSIYCDTTFLNEGVQHIVTREECESAIVREIYSHVSQGDDYHVLLKLGARIGYENVYRVLYNQHHYQTHIHEKDVELYEDLPSVLETVTTNPYSSQVHACCRYISTKTGEDGEESSMSYRCRALSHAAPDKIKHITLSTMWFIHSKEKQVCKTLSSHHVRVCYSFHSSYEEIKDLVLHLKPDAVYPNVVPVGRSMKQAKLALQSILCDIEPAATVGSRSNVEFRADRWWLSASTPGAEPSSKRNKLNIDSELDDLSEAALSASRESTPELSRESTPELSRESTPELNLWSDSSEQLSQNV